MIRLAKIAGGLSAVLLVAIFTCTASFRIWSWNDLHLYCSMKSECHPIWRELYFGRLRAGQNVEDVIARTKPIRVEQFGEFAILNYQRASLTGVTITAKNGKLARAAAWSCTWDRKFFDELSDADAQAFERAYTAHLATIQDATPKLTPASGGM